MEKRSYAEVVKGCNWEDEKNYNLKDEDVCDWGDGYPGEPMINNKYGFKYHSISTLPKEEKKRSPAKYGKR